MELFVDNEGYDGSIDAGEIKFLEGLFIIGCCEYDCVSVAFRLVALSALQAICAADCSASFFLKHESLPVKH